MGCKSKLIMLFRWMVCVANLDTNVFQESSVPWDWFFPCSAARLRVSTAGSWRGSDPGQTPSLLSPPQLQATWKQLVRCCLRCSQFWCLLEMVYFSWIPKQVGAQDWVRCSEWNKLQTAPHIPRGVVNRRAMAIEGRVCVILTSHSYLHQWEKMVHGDFHRVLQPALINDLQTLLLCLFLAGIANVPQAVP